MTRNISVSEVNSYLRCRRSWDYTSAHRQSLKHRVTPKIYFVIGSAIHEAIDAQAMGLDPMVAFEAYVDKDREKRVTEYIEQTGQKPMSMQFTEFEECVDLARALTTQYFDHYGWGNPLEDRGLKYIATEIPFSIELESGNRFVGTIDGLATDIATESKFWIVENKSADRKPVLDEVQSWNQFQGYVWAFLRLTGEMPVGVLYNGVMKKLVKEPKTLKNGKLSVAKDALVTSASFLKGLQEGGHDPVEYIEYLTMLEERERQGDDRFFFRELFTYTENEIEDWYSTVLEPVDDEMAREDLKIIPNYTNCRGCLVRDLCGAERRGEPLSDVIDLRYKVGSYGTIEAVRGVTPDQVSSVEELLAVLKV